MQFIETEIPEVVIIQPEIHSDERGSFREVYRAAEFARAGLPTFFAQENFSNSIQGTVRGLHYQIRRAQGKLIQVMRGEIFDVAVDLRRSSKTFGKWVGQQLSESNKQLLWIPPGFAHGFYVISEQAGVFYKTTDSYAPEWERTLFWNDPELQIDWPIPESVDPIVSAKDAKGALFSDVEYFA